MFDPSLLEAQRRALFSPKPPLNVQPLTDCAPPLEQDRLLGEQLIAEGKMGCILLAGGLGERLGHVGPKGTYLLRGKSLFEILFEKVRGPLAVMTSPLNHAATVSFLKEHGSFGVKNLDLFTQRSLPLLDDQGHWLLDAQGNIRQAPDGNGGALKAFFEAGLWHKWQEKGVEFVRLALIDNPLADPYDAEVCGAAARTGADVVIQAIAREPGEHIGALALSEGRIKIVEYTELPSSPDFPLGNSGLFCFSLPFVQRAASIELPWHVIKREAWKCESFIFDLLDHAHSVHVVLSPRARCFAPIKTKADAAL